MTQKEWDEAKRDLRQLYEDGLTFETSAAEIDLKIGTKDYEKALLFWNAVLDIED